MVSESGEPQTLACLDGTRIEASRVVVHRDGISCEVAGGPMQFPWDMLAGASFLAERRALVDWNDATSLRDFADWCMDMGLDKEWAEVAELYFRLTKRKLVNPWSLPQEKGESPIAPASHSITFKVEDEALRTALNKGLEPYAITDDGAKATHTIAIAKVAYEEVKVVEFFGALVFATYRASVLLQVLDAKGEVVDERRFASGECRSTLSRDDARGMCQKALVEALVAWLAPRYSR